MKKFGIAAAMFVALVGSVHAGGMAEPVMEPEVVAEAASSSSAGIIIPILLLLLIAAAVSSSDSTPQGQV
jgi:hypothetical protein